jgi:hypothetical protein
MCIFASVVCPDPVFKPAGGKRPPSRQYQTRLDCDMTDAATAAQTSAATERPYIRPVTIFTIPIDRDTLFSNHKGVYKKQVENRQRRLIVKSTLIKSFMHYGECIRCITTAYSPVPTIEKELTGPAFLYFKRALLIFTDRRILHVPTRFNRSPRGAVSQILYADCAGIDIKGAALEVRYKNGEREVFNHIGRKERKKLRVLISNECFQSVEEGKGNHLQGRTYLCPRCTHVLPKDASSCEGCDLVFKNMLKAGLWTFLIPGGGFFYFRYPLAGTMVALFEIFLIAFILFDWVEITKVVSPDHGMTALPAAGLIMGKLISLFYVKQMVQEYVAEN